MAPGQVKLLSEQICDHVIASPLFAEAERIFAYYPMGNEVDIRRIVRAAWRQGKHVAFPRVSGNDMSFLKQGFFKASSRYLWGDGAGGSHPVQ